MNMSFSENAQKLVRFSLKLFSSATQGGFFNYFFFNPCPAQIGQMPKQIFYGNADVTTLNYDILGY